MTRPDLTAQLSSVAERCPNIPEDVGSITATVRHVLKYTRRGTEAEIGEVSDPANLDPVHTGPDPYGHHINLTSFKTSMTLKFVIILQNLIKTYHRKSGKSKCDRKVTELNVEITRIRSRVNGVLVPKIFLDLNFRRKFHRNFET